MPIARRTISAERDLQNIAFQVAFVERQPVAADGIIDELIAETEKTRALLDRKYPWY